MVQPSSDKKGPAVPFDFDLWQTGGGKGSPLPFAASCFAAYWDKVPSLCREEKGASPTKLQVDGHSFMGRTAVYKYLIENTGDIWGSNHERHFLWGYGALLDWEARSGRLCLRKTDSKNINNAMPSDEISPKSWWGYMNFMFSVCILLGAEEAGVLGKVEVELLDDRSKELVKTDVIVKECIQLWKTFWKEGFSTFSQCTLSLLEKKKSIPEKELLRKMDLLYDDMNNCEWVPHTTVFRHAVFDKGETSEKLLAELVEPERSFCIGFCKIVDLLAVLNLRTDMKTTSENGIGYLPLCMVDDKMMEEINKDDNVSDIEKKRKVTVLNMHNLCTMDDKTLNSVVSFWKRVGQWESARKNVPQILENLTHGGPLGKMKEIVKVLFYFALPASKTELAAWIAIGALCLSFERRKASFF